MTFKSIKEKDSLLFTKYKNQPFQIMRSLTSDEVDAVSPPMFKIQFEDGHQTDALMEEIFESNIVMVFIFIVISYELNFDL